MSSSHVNGWSTHLLSELIDRKFTGPSPTCEERAIASSEEWGLLKTTAVTWTGWNENAHKVPPKSFWGNESIEVKPNDVLITKAGPRHRVGVVVHVAGTRPHLMVSGKMVGLRPKTSKIVPSILAALLSTQDAQDYLNSRTTGMAESQTNFADEALLQTKLKVPPMPEQWRIAEILDTLDSQIRTSERIIAKLKLAEQGLINDVFEVRATKWKSFRLCDVTSKITDGTHQAVVTEDNLAESVPFLYVSCVRDGQIDWQSAGRISQSTYTDISKGRLPSSGMVLYTAVGSYGHAAVVRKEQSFGFQRHIACIYPNMAKVSGDFIAAFLNSSSGRLQSDRLAVGNAQKTVTLGALGDFEIHVPELPEQQEIVNALSAASGRVAANQRSLAKLHLVKRGLMSDLLTGRVRVPMETAS